MFESGKPLNRRELFILYKAYPVKTMSDMGALQITRTVAL
jgi:hypothetical protein